MGVSSSQPIPSSQDNRSSPHPAKPVATPRPARRAPRYTPTMDDEAASQQLMSEARATTHSADYDGPAIPLNFNGASQDNTKESSDSGKKKAKKLGSRQTARRDAAHGAPLPTYSLKDLHAFIGPSTSKSRTFSSALPSTQIEVPDTQIEMHANGVPSPTPLTASGAISPDASNKRPKKSKKRIQSKVDLTNGNTVPATPYEEVTGEAPPSPEEDKSQASRKRRRKDKTRTSANSVNFEPAGISEAPTATQETAAGTAAEETDKQNGILDAEGQVLTPRGLLSRLNAEKSQKSQTTGKASSPANAHEGVTEQSSAEVELPDAAATANAAKTPDATQSGRKRKRTKKGKQIAETPALDWEAQVRNLNETPSQAFTFEDSDGDNTSRSRKTTTNNGKAARYSIGGIARTPRVSRADPSKTYERAHDDDDRTAADRALEMMHELGYPPDKRTSGDFTADEKELLRRAIRDYQERSGLDTADLVEIIHWTQGRNPENGANTTYQTEAQFKKDCDAFWDEIKNAGLLRKLKELKKHIRATYHMCQRGRWSQDEDEQLQELVNLHPGQWKLIATQLNRLEIDTYNRWKDYVRHGEKRITKRWTVVEEENFLRILCMVCQRVEDLRAELGQPPLDDYYPVINWHEVCREMGDTRSRLQCQSKWKIMRARVPPAILDVEIKPRRTPPPDEVSAEINSARNELQKSRSKAKAKKDRQLAVTEADLNPPGPDDMLWGDRFDLVDALIQQVAANESSSDDQIVWQDVAEKMNQKWSVHTLQTAFKQLCGLVLDPGVDDDLTTRLLSLLKFIKENHMNEAEDRYQPAQDIEVNDGEGGQGKSSKKRKRQSPSSGKASTKMRSKSTPSGVKAFKSKELITDSEPEL